MSGSVARPPRWSQLLAATVGRSIALFRRAAFAGAVALPAVYLPALLAGGIGPVTPGVALVLLGLHVLTLVAGHRHDPAQSTVGR